MKVRVVSYGVQIMPHFKFADEWQALGSSTTLTGRILAKFGLIETIEQYFNPERESRWEFPLLGDIIVAADDMSCFANPMTQSLRSAVISDTDSVAEESLVETNLFGTVSFSELNKLASTIEYKNGKQFAFFDTPLKIKNVVNGNVEWDDVEFVYSHDCEKDMYEIELEDGKIILVTEDHSVMVLDDTGNPTIEKKPTELSTNDICVVVNS